MSEIIPAILTDDPEELVRLVHVFERMGVERAHLDICDGIFVPTHTITGYEELRRLAAVQMSRERPGHTLQATALVHEAYLRLIGEEPQNWNSRGHFFAAAAEAMKGAMEKAKAEKEKAVESAVKKALDEAAKAKGEEGS